MQQDPTKGQKGGQSSGQTGSQDQSVKDSGTLTDVQNPEEMGDIETEMEEDETTTDTS